MKILEFQSYKLHDDNILFVALNNIPDSQLNEVESFMHDSLKILTWGLKP